MLPKNSNHLHETAIGIRAVQYVRMSKEHQQYSIANQVDAIRQYAERHGIEIVRTYADEGRSGVTFNGRDGIKRLIADVQSGKAEFSSILVYDVSRWGRFQDADEGAYYEFLCKRSGITVQYCAEQFENDGGTVSTIVKGLKRAMAGEYSRELSAKVFAGQRRLVTRGFRQGGPPGYGLRRLLIDEAGNPKGQLARGQYKSIQNDRVVLIPGPESEVETVRWIFRTFVKGKKRQRDIVDILNVRGITGDCGRPWTQDAVHSVLTNEKYIGNNVWNHVTDRLGNKKTRNPPDLWIRADNAFEPIVDRRLFERAARRLADDRALPHLSDDELLRRLKILWEAHGFLSCAVIDKSDQVPSRNVYQKRFGGLLRSYKLIGYTPNRDYHYVDDLPTQNELLLAIVDTAVFEIKRRGGTVVQDTTTKVLTVNHEFTARVGIIRCQERSRGCLRWEIRFDRKTEPDIKIAVRLNGTNDAILDYYIFPRVEVRASHLRLAEHNDISIDRYRYDTLEPLYQMAIRHKAAEPA
jgi:DNA invertase Pin-like site-specific DNA recombinase